MIYPIIYKFYSIKFSNVIAGLSFFGVILVPLLTIITNNSSVVGIGLLTLNFLLVPFIIWILGHHYFYREDHKFITFEEYFTKYENELCSHIDTANFKNYLKIIDDFLHSDRKVLFIHSITGYGKSHLLREALLNFNEMDKDRKTLFVSPDSYHLSMGAYLEKELEKNSKYIIIWDDVEQSDEIKELLSYCENKDIKIIFTFRNCELNEISGEVNRKSAEIKIKWEEEDLVYFFRKITGQNSIEDNRFIIQYSNPSLILTKIESVNKSNFDFKKFDILVDNLDQDIKSSLKRFNHTSEENRNLLINIACIVPFQENNDEILENLEIQTNFEKNEISKIIENLVESGLLTKINNSVRFNSDILCHMYLFFKIKDYSCDELELLTNGFANPNIWYLKKNIYQNLGNASQIIGTLLEKDVTPISIHSFQQYFSNILNKWIDEEDKTFGMKRKERLDYLQYFCLVAPERCLDLLNTYLDSEAPNSSQNYLNFPLNTDDFGPIIILLTYIPSIENEIIDIIKKMESKGMTGTYGNYRPRELIKYLVSPFENFDSNSILHSLNILETDLDDGNIKNIFILSSALNEIFSISKHRTRWGFFEFQSYEVKLQEHPNLVKIRNKALEILKKMINHHSLEVKIESFKIAREMGERNSENEKNLKNQLIKEREEIVLEISNLIKKADLKLLDEIESLFLDWWALETPGTHKVENYLNNDFFPREIEYLAFKSLVSNSCAISDFDSFKSKAPKENRWSWFLRKQTEYRKKIREPKTYKKLCIALDKKYNKKKDLIGFLTSLDNNLSDDRNFYNPVMSCWFKLNPDLFISIKEDNIIWAKIPKRFQNQINSELGKFDEIYLEKTANEIFSELPNVSNEKLNSFIISLSKSSIKKKTLKTWLNKLVNNGSLDVKLIVISYLNLIFKDDVNSIIEIIYAIVSKETKLNDKLIFNLWTALELDYLKIKSSTLNELRRDLFCKLIIVPFIDYQAQNILDFVINNYNSLFKFVECRIKYSTKEKEISYRVLPSECFYYLKRQIKSYNDFEEFIEVYLSLYKAKPEINDYLIKIMNSLQCISNIDQYKRKYANKQIKLNNIENMIIILNFLAFNEENLSLFAEIGSKVTVSGKYDEIKKLLNNKSAFDSYSSKAGIVPPIFIEKLKILEKLSKQTDAGKFRNLINNLIENRKEEIKFHENLIQEFKYR